MDVVCLTEDDVPGAHFVHNTVQEHTNTQLKRWLKCHGLPTSGKRPSLIERCQKAVSMKVTVDSKIDDGKWYNLKIANNVNSSATCNQTPILPITGWKKFPSSDIPKHFNNGHIYHYLVESITSVHDNDHEHASDSTGSDLEADKNIDIHTSKPLTKGKNLFRSGHVKCMQDAKISNFYFVKSKVQASYAQKVYNTTVTLSSFSGTVKEGTCTCSASGLGRCSHVAALLFALEDYLEQFGSDIQTSTGKLCEWNKCRKKDKNPVAVQDTRYPSMNANVVRGRKPVNFVINSDPRPASLKHSELTSNEKNAFLSDLRLNIGEECGWMCLLDYEYQDFTMEDYGVSTLQAQCDRFNETLRVVACDNKSAPFCVEGTENQASSDTWRFNRWCRVTASVAKSVCCVKTGMSELLKNHMWANHDQNISIPSLQYGRDNEDNALQAYAKKHPSYVVEKTGLWVNPKYPELGASPDGIVKQTDTTTGLLEIKCPYVLKNYHPSTAATNLTPKQRNNFFCTCLGDGSLVLKRSHAYYYQIQMQLHICEQTFCDFVVWSPHGMSVERIFPDKTMWKYMSAKLFAFHKHYLVPEYFLQRIPRELKPIKFNY